jgi:hypothetical protein
MLIVPHFFDAVSIGTYSADEHILKHTNINGCGLMEVT